MKLSKKLAAIERLVEGKIVADVGCDHGYLAIKLALSGRFFVYACDLRKKPLEIAKKNAEKNNVKDKIKFVLSDGLKNLPHDVDCIVLAGMGGKLILRIIFQQSWVKNKNIKLIIQPQSFLCEVRSELYAFGFKIEKEVLVFEKSKFYVILAIRYCGEKKKISLKEAFIGNFVSKMGKDYEKFVFYSYFKIRKKLDGLKKAECLNFKEIERIKEIISLLEEEGKKF